MRPPLSLRPEDDLACALETMRSEGVRELPLVDAAGRVVDLIAETSIAHAYVAGLRGHRRSNGTSDAKNSGR